MLLYFEVGVGLRRVAACSFSAEVTTLAVTIVLCTAAPILLLS